MRMWGIDPKKLCRKHLLGEHVEMHMFAGTIKKGISITGYLENGLVDPSTILARHEVLAKEMVERGYNHNSPLDFPLTLESAVVDVKANRDDLRKRCPECKKRGV